MTRDASLSEFGGADDGSDGNENGVDESENDGNEDESGADGGDDGNEDESDGNASRGDEPGERGEDDRADPAASTYAWGEEYACSACDATVERAWRDDGALVCESCKRW